jgi:hypothetical protein
MTRIDCSVVLPPLTKDRMGALAHFLIELDPKAWAYEKLLTAFDTANNCGTICCAAGWLPRVDPKAWRWEVVDLDLTDSAPDLSPAVVYWDGRDARNGLMDYFHGLGWRQIDRVFHTMHDDYAVSYHAIRPWHVAAELARLAVDQPPYSHLMGWRPCVCAVQAVWPTVPVLN